MADVPKREKVEYSLLGSRIVPKCATLLPMLLCLQRPCWPTPRQYVRILPGW